MLAAILISSFALLPLGQYDTALAAGKTFYVDCVNGNDSANGTSTGSAWKTLGRANKANLAAGDSLLLKRGCTWTGPLTAKWKGTANSPITIGAYGSGAIPVIKNHNDGNVKISGAYQQIESIKSVFDLSAFNYINQTCGGQPQAPAWRVGFNFVGGHHNTLRDSVATGGSLGVNFTNSSHHNKFVYNRVVSNHGAWNTNSKWPQGGTAVFLHGDANEIAHNHFEDNRTLCWDESVTIELFDATNSNVHHNTSIGDKVFVETGSGKVTSNYNTFAYNVHTTGVERARFLVTRGNGQSYGPVWNTHLYNNTVYYTGEGSQGVVCSSCGPNVLKMRNNIIVAKGKAVFSGGGQLDEANNLFWKTDGGALPHDFIQGFTPHSSSQIANPKFAAPGQRDFHLQQGSPAINRGSGDSTAAGYKKDMDGDGVPIADKVDIGADETGASSASDEQSASPAISLPGRIQAENYKAGGEGVGYHDTTQGNSGGACKNDDVDLASTSDNGGGCNVGYIAEGEWLAYNINVPASGKYTFTSRVATIHGGRSFHIKVDGTNVTGSIQVPNTGGWQKWANVTTANVALPAGNHELRIVMETGDFNINYIDVDAVAGAVNGIALPGRIEAEDYKAGGPEVGFYDTSRGNSLGACREDDVDLANTQDVDGGCNVGNIAAGEWLAYDIFVTASGRYTFTARVATPYSERSFHIEIDGADVTGPIHLPKTNGWQKWMSVTSTGVDLAAGMYELRIVMDTGDFNLNYVDVQRLYGISDQIQQEPAEQEATLEALAAPAELSATPAGPTAIDLAWVDMSSDELGFAIERSTDGANWTTIKADQPGDVTLYSDTSVEPGQAYYYRVKALGQAGDSEYSNVARVTTPAQPEEPAAPEQPEPADEPEAPSTPPAGENVAPTAEFSISCNAYGLCLLDATTSVDPDGTIVDYSWDYSFGTAPTSAPALHYRVLPAGQREITLTVTDDDGAKTTLTKSITVN